MAMQTGVGLSKILLLAGAGYTGTIMMKNGKLSDLIGELQALVKGLERSAEGSEGDSDVSDAIAAQVRRLAMEVRQLASSRQITVMNGTSAGNLQSLAVPAAALGALGYGYMWWKGLSFSDLMYVTKCNMASAVTNLTKHLEQVSETLVAAKRHLTQRIQNLDDKMDKQNELSKTIQEDVALAREDICSIEGELESLHNLINGLDGKLDTLEYKQDFTNMCVVRLYNYFGGKSEKLPEVIMQEKLQLPVNKARNLLTDVESKGLKDFADELFESTNQTGVKSIKQGPVSERPRPLSRVASGRC
ncbi:PREDICTED: uncharacterized protein LOC104822101 [Tarenaya hassleriana]|uniref:uncharacterized protein LOC104822101 n=1 Tax=Tarenaya hassleriana TaxID=28532 RepID=UPI00053C1224|nr:PREDICTED: uncharacterized protein LOC104822101 [Tarenaya hassleriana]